MGNRISGHRGSQGDEWSWEPGEPENGGREPGRGGRQWLILAMFFVAAAVAFIGLALLLSSGGDDEGAGDINPTRTAPAVSTRSPRASPTARPATASPSNSFRFAMWSREEGAWRIEGLRARPAYHEGEYVPFMVRIDDTKPGRVYEITLVYQCKTTKTAAFDYLGGLSETDAGAVLVDPGPGRRPDATLPMPDDSSLTFDDSAERLFRLWGGTFYQPPKGPVPTAPCDSKKQLSLTVLAQDETVFLVLGAHLASATDWGVGKGASALDTAVNLFASVNNSPFRVLTVPPGAVTP